LKSQNAKIEQSRSARDYSRCIIIVIVIVIIEDRADVTI